MVNILTLNLPDDGVLIYIVNSSIQYQLYELFDGINLPTMQLWPMD